MYWDGLRLLGGFDALRAGESDVKLNYGILLYALSFKLLAMQMAIRIQDIRRILRDNSAGQA